MIIYNFFWTSSSNVAIVYLIQEERVPFSPISHFITVVVRLFIKKGFLIASCLLLLLLQATTDTNHHHDLNTSSSFDFSQALTFDVVDTTDNTNTTEPTYRGEEEVCHHLVSH
jgi:hypothetical protein